MRKLSIFALLLLLISQTILGPIGVVSANGDFTDPIMQTNEGPVTDEESSEDAENILDNELEKAEEDSDGAEKESESNDPKNEIEEDAPKDNVDGLEEEASKGEADTENKILPQSEIEAGEMPVSVITSTVFTIDGQTVSSPVTVQNGQTAEFRFNLELEAGHNYGPGSTLTYTLPDIFTNITFPEGTQFGELGEITKSGNDITITFNDNIIDNFGNGTAFEPGAQFFIAATFNNTGNDVNATINLPGQANIVLNFMPLGGSTITKNNGAPQPTGQNSDYIAWTVTVNTDLVASGTVPFIDTLTGGHTFDPNSVKITELTLKPDGTVLYSSDVTTDYTPSFNGTNTEMTINLDGTKAYEITYHTLPNDPGNSESVTYRNAAKYGDTPPVNRSATVNYGTPLNKKGSLSSANLETTWTIEYNYNKRTISQANAKLTDTWTTSGGSSTGTVEQKMVNNSFEVRDGNGGIVDNYKLTPTAQGFELQFNSEVRDAYTITYRTKPTDGSFITSDMKVTNTVKREDISISKNPSVTYNKTSFMLDKSTNGAPNYEAKTMDWTITANQAGYSLAEGTVFTDTFTNGNMELIEKSLEVRVGGSKLTSGSDYTVEKTDYTDKDNNVHPNKGGFTVALTNSTDQQVVITYTTDYDIRDVGSNNRQFHNSVTINNSGLPVAPSDSDEHRVAPEQTANGKKDGIYNYATKKFEWEVELNFNLNTLEDAIFEDVLPDTQTVDVESIKVLNGTLNSNGIFQPGSEIPVMNTATEPNKIAFSLGKITGPYKVTYESYDTDDVFAKTTGKVQITNNATLKDGTTLNASWTKTVGVNYTDELIKKKGSQIGGTAGIKWIFEFNYAQSNLNNIVITDTVGQDNDGNPNQLIKIDSFKVYKVGLSGKSDSASFDAPKQNTLLSSSEYELDVDIREGTFTLELPDGDSAYYIEYETIYMGDNNSTVTNEVQVNYDSADGNQASNNFSISNFRYGNAGTTVKVPFIVVKTDGETGKPMADVEFTLYSEFQPGVPLISKRTDADGVFDLGIKLTEGNYALKETTVEGYNNPGDINFVLHRESIEEIGKYTGKQVIVVENFKTGYEAACTEFILTIKDVDRNLVKNKSVTLTNKVTGKRYVMPTDSVGELILLPAEVNAGDYTVAIDENGTEVILGDITVTYDGECEYNLQPNPSCNNFTITLEDKNNVIRPNVTVTLKHEDGTSPEIQMTTDVDGKINLLSADTQTGVYKVYEGKKFLGTVKITYKDGCIETLVQAPACESFTLTVKDVDGNLQEAGISVTIKHKDGTIIAKDIITDIEGKVSLKLEAGEYDVFEGDAIEPFAEFSTNIECEAEVQPLPSCKDFTVMVKTEDDVKRSDVFVTVKDKAGKEIITIKTDEKGQIKVPSKDLPAGKYNLYEGELFIGEITVSYLNGCEAEVKGNPTCTTFTLTIQNVNGFAREAGVKITIKDSQGNLVTGPAGSEFTTVAGGIVTLDSLPKGTYTVYENGRVIGSFTVVNTCSAIVKPYPSGGGWTPPTYPEDPTNPPSENEKPADPKDPNKPGDKENPKDPDKEDLTDSEKPSESGEDNSPNDPNEEDPTNEEKPTKPGTPSDKDDSNNTPAGNQNGNDSSEPAGSNPGSTDGGKATGLKGNGQNVKASGKDTLPQTGEQHLLYMIILGFMLMIIGGVMIVRRKSVE